MPLLIQLAAGLCIGTLAATGAWAQEKLTGQQERMKSCNAQAAKKELKGDERREFMSDCLSADSTKDGKRLTAQQMRMRTCNAQAGKKDLKGDERKKFMSRCLES
jgi:hypothetical protein